MQTRTCGLVWRGVCACVYVCVHVCVCLREREREMLRHLDDTSKEGTTHARTIAGSTDQRRG
jgi:hypothetical protein